MKLLVYILFVKIIRVAYCFVSKSKPEPNGKWHFGVYWAVRTTERLNEIDTFSNVSCYLYISEIHCACVPYITEMPRKQFNFWQLFKFHYNNVVVLFRVVWIAFGEVRLCDVAVFVCVCDIFSFVNIFSSFVHRNFRIQHFQHLLHAYAFPNFYQWNIVWLG